MKKKLNAGMNGSFQYKSNSTRYFSKFEVSCIVFTADYYYFGSGLNSLSVKSLIHQVTISIQILGRD